VAGQSDVYLYHGRVHRVIPQVLTGSRGVQWQSLGLRLAQEERLQSSASICCKDRQCVAGYLRLAADRFYVLLFYTVQKRCFRPLAPITRRAKQLQIAVTRAHTAEE